MAMKVSWEEALPDIEHILKVKFEETGDGGYRAENEVVGWVLSLYPYGKQLILENIPLEEGVNFAISYNRIEMWEVVSISFSAFDKPVIFISSHSQLELYPDGVVVFLPIPPKIITQFKIEGIKLRIRG
jgi:hypothetical protein